MNTCDPELVWTTDHCDDQDHPRLTLQNLTFTHGNSTATSPDGGGIFFVSNNLTGTLTIDDTYIWNCPSAP